MGHTRPFGQPSIYARSGFSRTAAGLCAPTTGSRLHLCEWIYVGKLYIADNAGYFVHHCTFSAGSVACVANPYTVASLSPQPMVLGTPPGQL